MASIRLYFDFTSPYSYLASTQVDALAARTGVSVDWQPVFLRGILQATGNQPPGMLPVRAAYLLKDLPRWAAFYGVPFHMTPYFPLNSLAALRAAWALKTERPAAFAPFVHACFRAAWADGVDISDQAAVARLAGDAHDFVAAAAGAQAWKDALKKATDEAVAAGAFGVPSFVLEDGELYFGNDRLGLLERRLTG